MLKETIQKTTTSTAPTMLKLDEINEMANMRGPSLIVETLGIKHKPRSPSPRKDVKQYKPFTGKLLATTKQTDYLKSPSTCPELKRRLSPRQGHDIKRTPYSPPEFGTVSENVARSNQINIIRKEKEKEIKADLPHPNQERIPMLFKAHVPKPYQVRQRTKPKTAKTATLRFIKHQGQQGEETLKVDEPPITESSLSGKLSERKKLFYKYISNRNPKLLKITESRWFKGKPVYKLKDLNERGDGIDVKKRKESINENTSYLPSNFVSKQVCEQKKDALQDLQRSKVTMLTDRSLFLPKPQRKASLEKEIYKKREDVLIARSGMETESLGETKVKEEYKCLKDVTGDAVSKNVAGIKHFGKDLADMKTSTRAPIFKKSLVKHDDVIGDSVPAAGDTASNTLIESSIGLDGSLENAKPEMEEGREISKGMGDTAVDPTFEGEAAKYSKNTAEGTKPTKQPEDDIRQEPSPEGKRAQGNYRGSFTSTNTYTMDSSSLTKSEKSETSFSSTFSSSEVESYPKPQPPPTCSKCKESLQDGKILRALKKLWHPDCFKCRQCLKPISCPRFYAKDGDAYCEEDFIELFLEKCGGCSKPIQSEGISALQQFWHKECFKCSNCEQTLCIKNTYKLKGNDAFCISCFSQKFCDTCDKCGESVSDGVLAHNKVYHLLCFTCNVCEEPMQEEVFLSDVGRMICSECFVRLSASVEQRSKHRKSKQIHGTPPRTGPKLICKPITVNVRPPSGPGSKYFMARLIPPTGKHTRRNTAFKTKPAVSLELKELISAKLDTNLKQRTRNFRKNFHRSHDSSKRRSMRHVRYRSKHLFNPSSPQNMKKSGNNTGAALMEMYERFNDLVSLDSKASKQLYMADCSLGTSTTMISIFNGENCDRLQCKQIPLLSSCSLTSPLFNKATETTSWIAICDGETFKRRLIAPYHLGTIESIGDVLRQSSFNFSGEDNDLKRLSETQDLCRKQSLGGITSRVTDAVISNDHFQKCNGCISPIFDVSDGISVLQRYWHKNCFKCCSCLRILYRDRVYKKTEEEIFCIKCFAETYSDYCEECGEIVNNGVLVSGKVYHSSCLTCNGCDEPVEKEAYCSDDNRMICAHCFITLSKLYLGVHASLAQDTSRVV